MEALTDPNNMNYELNGNRKKKVINFCQDVCCLQLFKQNMYLQKKSFKMSVYLMQKTNSATERSS